LGGGSVAMRGFKMGTLDHMHLLVPDRYQAARWYQENLGFEIMKQYEAWAEVDGDASQFVTFANGLLSTNISGTNGEPLKRESVVDHDLCYAYYFQDLYANRFELDCYDYDDVKRELIQKHALTPVRFW
jgi:hypothetical protein